MTGVPGQRWAESKKKPRKKTNVAIPSPIFEKIQKLAEKTGDSINKTLNKIIAEYFK